MEENTQTLGRNIAGAVIGILLILSAIAWYSFGQNYIKSLMDKDRQFRQENNDSISIQDTINELALVEYYVVL